MDCDRTEVLWRTDRFVIITEFEIIASVKEFVMDKGQRKAMADAYKQRRPEKGVVELRCIATGERFLGTASDTAVAYNSLQAKLGGGLHPNKRLQQLWNEHGEEGFAFAVVQTIDYDDPAEVTLDDLRALRELCLAEDPSATIIWK